MAGAADLDRILRGLDRLAEPARLWWRDDDAGRGDARLDRLLGLAREARAPLALAVVPAWLEQPVARAILAVPEASVLQHGWAHLDRAAPGERRIELGGSADRRRLAGELERGRLILARAFGERFLPVLVPPWNRIARDVVAALPGLGYRVLSVWDEGDLGPMPERLARLDVHVDPIDWRGGRRWIGRAAIAERLLACLERGIRPIGLVTHHLVMDEEAWHELAALLAILRAHPNVRFMPVGCLLGEAG